MITILLLACDGSTPEGESASSTLPMAPAVAADPIPVTDDPARYGDAWLVLLQSSKEDGKVPESWAALSAAGIEGVAPERLDSGHYKGLMPCYEIVVAMGTADKSAASTISKALTAAGVDNYMKNAGPYIGPDPRIEAACSATASNDAPDGVRIAVSRDGALRVPLDLPEALAERALAGLTVSMRGEDPSAWSASIPVQTIGEVSVGQTFTVAADGAARDCAVTGFEAVQEGQPHFSYIDTTELLSRPMCGQMMAHAVLDCDSSIGAALVVDAGTAAPSLHILPPLSLRELAPEVRQHDSFAAVHAELTAQAQGMEEALSEEIAAADIDGTGLTWLRAQLTTGEGLDFCGNNDINAVLVATLDADGAISAPFITTGWSQPMALARIGGVDHWLMRTWTESWELLSSDGEVVYRWNRDFCDCTC